MTPLFLKKEVKIYICTTDISTMSPIFKREQNLTFFSMVSITFLQFYIPCGFGFALTGILNYFGFFQIAQCFYRIESKWHLDPLSLDPLPLVATSEVYEWCKSMMSNATIF